MHLKDHYKTLELEPSATMQEIKTAYRKLAMQHHPDVNQDDPYAVARFNEIKEAYETLTTPSKRYDYLQQRWYNRATGNHQTAKLITPVNILKQALEFERYTAMLDMFRMDQQQLFDYINELLKESTVQQLQQFNETAVNKQIITTLLKPLALLQHQDADLMRLRLQSLAGSDQSLQQQIDATLLQMKGRERWERYKWIVVLVVTAAICLLIAYFA